jgi:hypothetical protein
VELVPSEGLCFMELVIRGVAWGGVLSTPGGSKVNILNKENYFLPSTKFKVIERDKRKFNNCVLFSKFVKCVKGVQCD